MADTRRLFTSRIWRYASYGIAGLVISPVLVILASWLLPVSSDHWSHLYDYVLTEVALNTAALLIGVGLLSAIVGTVAAWLCSQFEFPGVFFFRRALLFPFAIPAYVSAFVYIGLLDFSGPLRSFLRDTSLGDSWMPEVRSLGGAVVLLSLSLFPYIYALAFNAFQSQGRSLMEASRSLGHSSIGSFIRLSLPYARPHIIGGICLVSLEVLNDFGTVSAIGISTFTTAIYKAWFGFFSPETAAQLSSLLILIAFAVYSWDQVSRRSRDYRSESRAPTPSPLSGSLAAMATGFCLILFLSAFAIPLLQIAVWSWSYRQDFLTPEWRSSLGNSFLLGLAAASLTTLAGFILVFAKRSFHSRSIDLSYRFSQLGYGIPGAVIAVGVFIPLARLDHLLVSQLEAFLSYDGGLLLTGTVFSMIVALSIRFLAVTSSSLDAGMSRVPASYDEAAGLYGMRGWSLATKIHWPLLRNSFAAGFLLAFVDIIKEMPLTLITRPMGWDTLSVRIYSLISEGEWERAAVPALGLILVGMLPLLLFSGRKSHD